MSDGHGHDKLMTYRVQRASNTDHSNAGIVAEHEVPRILKFKGYLDLFNPVARRHPCRVEA